MSLTSGKEHVDCKQFFRVQTSGSLQSTGSWDKVIKRKTTIGH